MTAGHYPEDYTNTDGKRVTACVCGNPDPHHHKKDVALETMDMLAGKDLHSAVRGMLDHLDA